jgi:formylglycine-generating enzyme required for sulfatase activity
VRPLHVIVFAFVPALVVGACGLFPDLAPYGRCADGGCEGTDGSPLPDGGARDATDELAPPSPDGGCTYAHPPTMVRLSSGCIDSTEVSRAQYEDFVAASPTTPKHDGPCAWNLTYQPDKGYIIANTKPSDPIRGVDWCDARDYCAWAGKRLCGKVGGGSLTFDGYVADRKQSEWYMACSQQGKNRSYPYGTDLDDTYKAGYCNIGYADAGQHAQTPVGSLPQCTIPDAGVYDMIGNVMEWIDACESTSDAGADRCRTNGGVWRFGDYATCDFNATTTDRERSTQNDWSVGFRCCAN